MRCTTWSATGAAALAATALLGSTQAQTLGGLSAQSTTIFDPLSVNALAQTAEEDGGFALFDANTEGYDGAQGLISLQGPRGSFLNPMSGTLGQGQFTVQWCTLVVDQKGGNSDLWGNGFLASYGITDWLEVSGFTVFVDVDALGETLAVGGPAIRARVIKETDALPEVSVGGLYFDGDSTSDLISRNEVYVAASKKFDIDEDGWVQAFRLHGGVRQIWNPESPADDEGTVGYIGGELFLPYDLSFIAEVNTQEDVVGPRTPWAYGLQFKPADGVLGITMGCVNDGTLNRPGFYFGIGGVFEF